jgi:hypothetical protein
MFKVKVPHITNIYTVQDQLAVIFQFDYDISQKIQAKHHSHVNCFNFVPKNAYKNVSKNNVLGLSIKNEFKSQYSTVEEFLTFTLNLLDEYNSDLEYEVPVETIDNKELCYPYSSIFH